MGLRGNFLKTREFHGFPLVENASPPSDRSSFRVAVVYIPPISPEKGGERDERKGGERS
jgi:hypothetical protein